MSHVPSSLLAVARRQHGLVSLEQISTAGISAYRRRALLTHGLLTEVHRGVYRLESCPSTFEQRCLAPCLADEGVVVSGPSAGRLWGLRRMPAGPVHLMVFRRNLRLRGTTVHRTEALPDSDVVTRPDGIRQLAPPRLIFDLARFLDDADLESVVEQVLDKRMCTMPTLFATGRRLASAGRDGSNRFARVVRARPSWSKPQQSDLEVKVVRALRRHGVKLATQLRVELDGSTVVHLDAGDPTVRFGVEVDHVTWHGGRLDAQYDKWRDRQLQRIGWVVPRVTDEDLISRFDAAIADLVTIYRRCRLASH